MLGGDGIKPARGTRWHRRELSSRGASGNSVIPGCGRTFTLFPGGLLARADSRTPATRVS